MTQQLLLATFMQPKSVIHFESREKIDSYSIHGRPILVKYSSNGRINGYLWSFWKKYTYLKQMFRYRRMEITLIYLRYRLKNWNEIVYGELGFLYVSLTFCMVSLTFCMVSLAFCVWAWLSVRWAWLSVCELDFLYGELGILCGELGFLYFELGFLYVELGFLYGELGFLTFWPYIITALQFKWVATDVVDV